MKEEYNIPPETHFIPADSDFCVGYEFEIFAGGKWTKTKLRHVEELAGFLTGLYNRKYRTAYLTKEQIEAEGWTLQKTIEGYSYFKQEADGSWDLCHCYKGTLEVDSEDYDLYYRGPCKSINELRKIESILGIKE